MKSIYETIKEREFLENISKIVEKAERVDFLKKECDLTLFCPNDSAFGAYSSSTAYELDTARFETNPIGQIDDILKTKESALSSLNDHLIHQKINTEGLRKLDAIVTISKKDLPIVLSYDQVMVGSAAIIIPNIECSNGIIHVINSVLVPGY